MECIVCGGGFTRSIAGVGTEKYCSLHCRDIGAFREMCSANDELRKRIATLEQQYAKLRDEYNGLVFVNNELEQQLNDARELSCDGCINNNVNGKAKYCSDCLRIQNSFYVDKYEQAIAERDHIVDGNKMVCGEKK